MTQGLKRANFGRQTPQWHGVAGAGTLPMLESDVARIEVSQGILVSTRTL